MERTLIKNLNTKVGEEVTIKGWVNIRRDHGKLIFIDLRDSTGIVQCVALPNHTEAHEVANKVRSEWVVSFSGMVNKRPEKMAIKDTLNGDVELEITAIEILNESETPPFNLTENTDGINENIRLENRYIDLRSDRLQKNIRRRHEVSAHIRNQLSNEGFVEIETPLLTKSTPEGARDFLVPSRLDQGTFYALPQSPQQYKQLLMSSGFEKYFQFAKCLRDEDSRGDRQPEFTQLDLEMSFVKQEDVMALNEKLLISLVEDLYPEKRVQQKPFPRITYKEAMEKYGSDRPDLRENKEDADLLAFCWVIDFPFFEKTEKDSWTFTHNPFSMPKEEFTDDLVAKTNIENILTTQYDIVLNGFEIGGGSIRAHKESLLKSVFQIMGFEDDKIEKNFGHMLKAFKLGTPPHGGIAWGFDRLMMLLQNEANIREVIAFPKTGEGRELLMNAPSEVSSEQLKDLGISLKKETGLN